MLHAILATLDGLTPVQTFMLDRSPLLATLPQPDLLLLLGTSLIVLAMLSPRTRRPLLVYSR